MQWFAPDAPRNFHDLIYDVNRFVGLHSRKVFFAESFKGASDKRRATQRPRGEVPHREAIITPAEPFCPGGPLLAERSLYAWNGCCLQRHFPAL